jgi:hypothetical protein
VFGCKVHASRLASNVTAFVDSLLVLGKEID